MLTYPKNLEGSITIIGEKGTVRIGGVAVNKIEHWTFAEPDPDDEQVERASYETTSVYGHGHTGYYDNVLEIAPRRGGARDRRTRGPAVARAADRHLSLGARRAPRGTSPRVLNRPAAMGGAPFRIAYLIQQYAPEVGAGPARAGEMVRRWTAAGAEVTVITAMPNRPEGRIHAAWRGRMFGEEVVDGARILRSWLFARPGGGFATTLLNNVTFAAGAGVHALRRGGRFDVLIASSPPWFPLPIGVMLSRWWKVPLVLELRDLWPDYLAEMGTLRSTSLHPRAAWRRTAGCSPARSAW